MKHCSKRECLFYGLTIVANLIMIIVILLFASQAYGKDAQVALLFLIPPCLSLIALRKDGDKEERALKKRIRKAHLRKELDELKKFDPSE